MEIMLLEVGAEGVAKPTRSEFQTSVASSRGVVHSLRMMAAERGLYFEQWVCCASLSR